MNTTQKTCCPTCGRTIPAAKSPKAYHLPERAELDRQVAAEEITKDQYFAGCKSIATRDDARFFLRVTSAYCPQALQVQVGALLVELETRKATTTDAKRLWELKFAYRCQRATQTRHEWHTQPVAA